jgi:hypothetical protein
MAAFCVSTVSIRRRRNRALRKQRVEKTALSPFGSSQPIDLIVKSAPSASFGRRTKGPGLPGSFTGLEGSRPVTVLTVLTVFSHEFSCDAVIRMIRLPPRPSRLKVISMPSVQSEAWPSAGLQAY